MSAVILTVIVLLVLFWIIAVRKRIKCINDNINDIMSRVGVLLSSRWDALSTLSNIIKAYNKCEYDFISDYIRMRAVVTGKSAAAKANAQEIILTEAMNKIVAVAKNYPELETDENYINIMNSVKEYDNLAHQLRLKYNDSVTNLNRVIRSRPAELIACILGFSQCNYLEKSDKQSALARMKREVTI